MHKLIFLIEGIGPIKCINDKEDCIYIEEIEVLKQLGLKCDFGKEELTIKFINSVRQCVAIYVDLYITRTKLIYLQQLCIDQIPSRVNFQTRVSNLRLKVVAVHPKWY